MNAPFFTLERQFLTGVFGGLRRVVVRLQKHRRLHVPTTLHPLSVVDRGGWKEVRTR